MDLNTLRHLELGRFCCSVCWLNGKYRKWKQHGHRAVIDQLSFKGPNRGDYLQWCGTKFWNDVTMVILAWEMVAQKDVTSLKRRDVGRTTSSPKWLPREPYLCKALRTSVSRFAIWLRPEISVTRSFIRNFETLFNAHHHVSFFLAHVFRYSYLDYSTSISLLQTCDLSWKTNMNLKIQYNDPSYNLSPNYVSEFDTNFTKSKRQVPSCLILRQCLKSKCGENMCQNRQTSRSYRTIVCQQW